jgi:hypothetical protein
VTDHPVEFVLDEVRARLVDDDEFDRIGEAAFEATGECQAGVSGTEDDDAHTGRSAPTAKKGRTGSRTPGGGRVDGRDDGNHYTCERRRPGRMNVEGFVCWTARSVDDDAELRRLLDTQLPSGSHALHDAREAGLLEGTDLRPRGLAAAHRFADRSGLPMTGATDAIADFSALLDALGTAARRGRRLGTDAVPDGFERVAPTVDRFDRSYHTVNVAREYPSGAAVELNYRSRDPSHAGERKPNVSSAILWLRGDVSTAYDHRTEWVERAADGDDGRDAGTGTGT